MISLLGTPCLIDDVKLTVLEGTELRVDTLEKEPVAFPFPVFQWTRNGAPAVNITNILAYGYPSVTFYSVSRTDAGTYSLYAENFVLTEDTSILEVGNDTGSFNLDVLCKPFVVMYIKVVYTHVINFQMDLNWLSLYLIHLLHYKTITLL